MPHGKATGLLEPIATTVAPRERTHNISMSTLCGYVHQTAGLDSHLSITKPRIMSNAFPSALKIPCALLTNVQQLNLDQAVVISQGLCSQISTQSNTLQLERQWDEVSTRLLNCTGQNLTSSHCHCPRPCKVVVPSHTGMLMLASTCSS